MPLGLPNHLAPRNFALAYASASHAIALYCLIGAAVAVLAVQGQRSDLILWPCLLALVPMFVSLLLLDRNRSTIRALGYLLIGGLGLYWYALTGSLELPDAHSTDSFVLDLPRLAILFVGAGMRPLGQVLWVVVALVVGEVSVDLAALQAGGQWSFDVGVTACALCLVGFVVFIPLARARNIRVQPSFARAARDEHLSAVRFRIEVKAAAIMHDTVLGHLAAIASSPPGPLLPDLRSQVTRDLRVLLGEEWLLEGEQAERDDATSWRSSTLYAAIEQARELGLEVEVTGDMSAVARLDAERARALGLATKQCLVNVIRHAGVSTAEVVVYGSETEISVMVVDAGKGFSEQETGADRLGLRQSVWQRIEAVDGAVQLWSTPGRGTSVMMRLPVSATDVAQGGAA